MSSSCEPYTLQRYYIRAFFLMCVTIIMLKAPYCTRRSSCRMEARLQDLFSPCLKSSTEPMKWCVQLGNTVQRAAEEVTGDATAQPD